MQIDSKVSDRGYQTTPGTTQKADGAAYGQTAEQFRALMQNFIDEHTLTVEDIAKSDNWRDMSGEQWDRLIEHMDKNLEDVKESLEKKEELQKEAAAKGAANAPADQKATAASSAALAAGANGVVGAAGVEEEDESSSEKMNWTHQLWTENQTILAKAKMANEFEAYVLEKEQELTLGADAFAGDSEIYNRYDKFI